MELPKKLSCKYRIVETFISEQNFYRAKAFDFSLNKTVLLTVIGSIDRVLFDTIKNKLFIKNNSKEFDFFLELFSLEHLDTNELYYTQEYADSFAYLNPTNIIKSESIGDWFYRLALPTFYNFLKISNQNGNFHGLISPTTIFYSNGSIKIGDFILGVILELAPPLIIESPWYFETFFNSNLNGIDSDTYAFLKVMQFINVQDYSKVFNTQNKNYNSTNFLKSVQSLVSDINTSRNNLSLTENYLFYVEIFLKNNDLLKKEVVLYKPKGMPLLNDMLSSKKISVFSDIVLVHINHYLNDILEFNKVLSSLFEHFVYIVVPYSKETKITTNNDYHTYYHEIINGEYVVKKDEIMLSVTSDFYTAMYEAIKTAFKNHIIPLVKKGKKIIIVEDGGFHYSVINELINTFPILGSSVIGAIEQTTSGIKRYKYISNSINIPYPVLSVARSKIKMRLESHFIARRVVDELNYLLYMANNFLSFHKVLIIGYGIIGRNICKTLDPLKCDVTVYDIDRDILQIAKEEGIKVIPDVETIEFNNNLIVIGATGESAFTCSMFFSFVTSDAHKIYLASASSKRIEFQNIISFFETGDKNDNYKSILDKIENIKIEQMSYGINYNFQYKGVDKAIILIANGYPVNFYRQDIISLTESVIDLIYCELLVLIQYLLDPKNELTNKLYLLGSKDLEVLDVQEELLVSRWFDLLSLKFNNLSQNVWDKFDVHPLEEKLRDKCLPNDFEVNTT